MRSALSLLAPALLAACAQVPELPAPPALRTPPQLASAASLAGEAAASWPTAQWWQAYGDAQLNRLVEEGLRDAPSMEAARARLLLADAAVGAARASRRPQLDAQGQVQLARPSELTGIPVAPERRGWNDTGQLAIAFGWELDFWGRNRALLQAALSQARAAEVELGAARLALASAIAESYAQLAGQHRDREIARRLLALREQSHALVRSRVDSGYDTEVAAHQARAAVHAMRSELAAIDAAIESTALQLAALVGAGPDRARELAAPGRPALPSIGLPPSLALDLLGRRPDLVAARWRVEAAQAQTGAARAAFYPNINLVGLVGLQSLGLNRLLDQGALMGAVGPAMSLPLFDGGRRAGAYTAARANADLAIAGYNATLMQALREVTSTLSQLHALELQAAETAQALDAARRAQDLARLRYAAGYTNYLEVMLAEDRYIAQERQAATLETRAFVQHLALQRALGGGVLESAPAGPAPAALAQAR